MRIKSFLLFRHLKKKSYSILSNDDPTATQSSPFFFNVNSTVFALLFICNLIIRLGEISPRYEQIGLKVLC